MFSQNDDDENLGSLNEFDSYINNELDNEEEDALASNTISFDISNLYDDDESSQTVAHNNMSTANNLNSSTLYDSEVDRDHGVGTFEYDNDSMPSMDNVDNLGNMNFALDEDSRDDSMQSNIIDMPLDQLEDDYGKVGLSDEDENDYKSIDQSSTRQSTEDCHQLSSPFVNGLNALRVEITSNDGGIKAETLKQSEQFKNRSEYFKDVIIDKNLNKDEEDVV